MGKRGGGGEGGKGQQGPGGKGNAGGRGTQLVLEPETKGVARGMAWLWKQSGQFGGVRESYEALDGGRERMVLHGDRDAAALAHREVQWATAGGGAHAGATIMIMSDFPKTAASQLRNRGGQYADVLGKRYPNTQVRICDGERVKLRGPEHELLRAADQLTGDVKFGSGGRASGQGEWQVIRAVPGRVSADQVPKRLHAEHPRVLITLPERSDRGCATLAGTVADVNAAEAGLQRALGRDAPVVQQITAKSVMRPGDDRAAGREHQLASWERELREKEQDLTAWEARLKSQENALNQREMLSKIRIGQPETEHKEMMTSPVVLPASDPVVTVPAEAPPKCDWSEHRDKTSDRIFYYNTVSKLSQWSKPQELVALEEWKVNQEKARKSAVEKEKENEKERVKQAAARKAAEEAEEASRKTAAAATAAAAERERKAAEAARASAAAAAASAAAAAAAQAAKIAPKVQQRAPVSPPAQPAAAKPEINVMQLLSSAGADVGELAKQPPAHKAKASCPEVQVFLQSFDLGRLDSAFAYAFPHPTPRQTLHLLRYHHHTATSPPWTICWPCSSTNSAILCPTLPTGLTSSRCAQAALALSHVEHTSHPQAVHGYRSKHSGPPPEPATAAAASAAATQFTYHDFQKSVQAQNMQLFGLTASRPPSQTAGIAGLPNFGFHPHLARKAKPQPEESTRIVVCLYLTGHLMCCQHVSFVVVVVLPTPHHPAHIRRHDSGRRRGRHRPEAVDGGPVAPLKTAETSASNNKPPPPSFPFPPQPPHQTTPPRIHQEGQNNTTDFFLQIQPKRRVGFAVGSEHSGALGANTNLSTAKYAILRLLCGTAAFFGFAETHRRNTPTVRAHSSRRQKADKTRPLFFFFNFGASAFSTPVWWEPPHTPPSKKKRSSAPVCPPPSTDASKPTGALHYLSLYVPPLRTQR